jgi:ABC-type transport system involved in Fe-S cluster assembly fused permease/ATPase subunit
MSKRRIRKRKRRMKNEEGEVCWRNEVGEIMIILIMIIGKTTIAKLLMSLYYPDEGTITIDGHNIKDINIQFLRKKISMN